MKYIADLHIHSKYSRACAKNLDLENIAAWCVRKGIKIVSTGDFTHPNWFQELKTKLTEAKPGLYRLKNSTNPTYFIPGTEISCIYSQGGKMRRLHICLFAPDFETVGKIIAAFQKRNFNLKSDGRPIIGMSGKDLAGLVLEINQNNFVVPAHAWTPWFAVFGSKSGFDSLEECFEELAPEIRAIETGLSSDPPMNWRLSALDPITLISNSDAHSLPNLGREANVFEIPETELSYQEIVRIIKEKDKKRFSSTIEFFPEEGKYHWDGHAACDYSGPPEKSLKNRNLCPVCQKPLTLGVTHRVAELADRSDISSADTIPYQRLIPLEEIIADHFQVGRKSKKVQREYLNLTEKFPEFKILIELPEPELKKITQPEIASAVIKAREGQVEIIPGYDGNYGKIKILNKKPKPKQKTLV